MLSDKTMVKLPLDLQLTISIPSGSVETTTSIPLSYIDGTGFDTELFPSALLNWANFYGSFRVLGSKIRVEFFPVSNTSTANGTVPITCSVFPSNSYIIGTGTTGSNPYGQAYVRYRVLAGLGAGNGPSNHIITNYMSSKKMFGQRVTEENDFQQSWTYTGASPNTANALSNPTETADWILSVNTSDNNPIVGVEPCITVAVVKVVYYISLEDRLQQAQIYGPAD